MQLERAWALRLVNTLFGRFEPGKVKETIAEVFKQKFSEGFEYNADDAAEMGTEVCTEIQARIKGEHIWNVVRRLQCRCIARHRLQRFECVPVQA